MVGPPRRKNFTISQEKWLERITETVRLMHQGTASPPESGSDISLPQTRILESSTRPACMTTDWPDVVELPAGSDDWLL